MKAGRTVRDRLPLRKFDVHVTRVTTYTVMARTEDHAIQVYCDTDPEEVHGETLEMKAELNLDEGGTL